MSVEMSLSFAAFVLFGNAFFVGAEFSLVSARRSSMELLAAGGSRRAKVTLAAMEQVSVMLAGAQLGITLCSLVFAAVGEPVIAHLLEEPFAALGFGEAMRHAIAFIIAMTLMVYLHVVVGEMVPKNLALAGPVRWALVLVPPLFYIVKITRPLITLLNKIANAVLRLFGVHQRDEIASSFSRDEVIGFVKESRREGLLSAEEEQLISSSLEFDSRPLKSIIVPVRKLATTAPSPSVADIEKLVRDTGYSRFPIMSSKGELEGYVHIKDILHVKKDKDTPIKSRELPVVSTTDTARTALRSMQRSGAHIAQVVNTRGQVAGVVMLEDVLEQLVGTIRDGAQKK